MVTKERELAKKFKKKCRQSTMRWLPRSANWLKRATASRFRRSSRAKGSQVCGERERERVGVGVGVGEGVCVCGCVCVFVWVCVDRQCERETFISREREIDFDACLKRHKYICTIVNLHPFATSMCARARERERERERERLLGSILFIIRGCC